MSDPGLPLFINTPQRPPFEAEVAGFGSRFFAAALDYTILSVLLLPLAVGTSETLAAAESLLATVLFVMVSYVCIAAYHLLFEWLWNGQTPGKRWLGLRIVQADGQPVTGRAIVIRNLVRLGDYLPVFYGVGIVALLLTPRTQRLGDLAARTIVIYERPLALPETPRQDLRVAYRRIKTIAPIPHYIDIAPLNADDQRGVVGYLQRRDTLTNAWLAVTVAQKVAGRMGYGGAPLRLANPDDAELFLEWVARAFEVRESQSD